VAFRSPYHGPRYHGPHFSWVADLAFLGALAAVALLAGALCSVLPWS
jgi:hypothetical protein